MGESRANFVLASICCSLLFFSLLSNPLPVLDEGGYLWISENMSWDRPYDWKLPWPPYEEKNAYIYAHPPLFLWSLKGLLSLCSIDVAQWGLALFWQTVLCGSVAWLSFDKLQKPWLGVLLWMSLAGVALPCNRSFMPDLQVCALATASMVIWICFNRSTGWLLLCGVLLGLASWTKYPALLLVFVPFIHATRIKSALLVLLGCASIVIIGEFWLYTAYDSIHLFEVIKRAPEIARSSFGSRFVGVFNRLPLSAFGLVFMLLLTSGRWKYLLFGFGYTIVSYIAVQMEISQVIMAGLLGAIGMQVLRLMAGTTAFHTWAWLVFLGVLLTHNYASPRYLLLAMLPLVILSLQQTSRFVVARIAIVGSFLITIALSQAEKFHSQEGNRLALESYKEFPSAHFSGEWTFAWRMQKMGASGYRNLKPDTVIVATESAGGIRAQDGYELHKTYQGHTYPFQLVSSSESVGYYADTLGYWPVILKNDSIEQVQIWKRK
jgi:hypothetical protein